MLLTGKPFVFCAGADINEFHGIDPETARLGSKTGHESSPASPRFPTPRSPRSTEPRSAEASRSFHCDYRTISTGVRHFGAGGLPRALSGLGRYAARPEARRYRDRDPLQRDEPLRQNKMLTGGEAHELGFADALFEPIEFLDESLAFLLHGPKGRAPVTVTWTRPKWPRRWRRRGGSWTTSTARRRRPTRRSS